MPRTKRPVKRQEKQVDDVELQKLDKLVAEKKYSVDCLAEREIAFVEDEFKILLSSIKSIYLEKTIGELRSELVLKEVPNTQKSGHSSRKFSHDDGYNTANSSQGSGDRGYKKTLGSSTVSRTTSRRSRSASASSRQAAQVLSKSVARRRSRSVYRTPAYNKGAVNAYPAITPKVKPNMALTVMRQPRQGEMVVSMSGSPVIVPSCYTMQPDEMANCNILLEDGTMLSLRPKELRQSQAHIPYSLMKPEVIKQLETLKGNLDKVLKYK